jgi:hypothetical protein
VYNPPHGDKKDQVENSQCEVGDAGLKLRSVPLEITFTLQPPDKLWRDNDNVLTGMKPMIDGMFQYLKINDHLITDTHILRRERMPGGGVWVELKEMP